MLGKPDLVKIMKTATYNLKWKTFRELDNFQFKQKDNLENLKIFKSLIPLINYNIKSLSNPRFNIDPIGGKYSFITSVMSSAYKRHGNILEAALKEKLKECNDFIIFNEDKFPITTEAKSKAALYEKELHKMKKIDLFYNETAAKDFLQVDLIVYNKKSSIVSSYELKRGNGYLDAGKKRSLRQDLMSTNFLLKDWMKKFHNISVRAAHSYVISYYGFKAVEKPFSLVRYDLDNHFKFSVVKDIEKVNLFFRNKLHKMIEDKIS